MTAPDSDASAALSRALLWLADASDGALTSKELAELLWLLPRMPLSSSAPPPPEWIDHPQPEPIRPASKPDTEVVDDEGLGDEPDPFVPPAAEAIDPHTPSVFPELPVGAASPPQEPLLPLALLPEAAELEELQATLAVRLAQAPPLGDPASLIRALRPILRRRPNTNRLKLDEERTAEAWAQTKLLLPLFQPTPAPWFEEVWVVVDAGQAMRVWHGLARALRNVLASTQVFPEVRLHWLSTKGSPADELRPREGSLVLLVSDAAGAHWWEGRMFDALEAWSRQCPTAILQPWPPWQWDRTALSVGEPLSIRNSAPAAANLCYVAERRDWWEEETLPVPPTLIPVIPAEQEALAIWSAVVMGEPGYATEGFALPAPSMRWASLQKRLAEAQPDSVAGSGSGDLPVADLWAAFCRSASPQAQRLLMVMATAPVLTLAVIGLLHEAKVHGSKSPLPIAEVLVSPLVAPIPNQDDGLDADHLQFALVPGLAELLIDRLSAADRLDVIRTVGALVERRWNSRFREPTFGAVLLNPKLLPEDQKDELGKGMLQFASVTARLLDSLPGEEARAFAERLRRGSALPPGSPWPPSMHFEEVEFETAQLVDAPELKTIHLTMARFVEVALKRIEFQTATMDIPQPVAPGAAARQASEGAAEGSGPEAKDHWPRLTITSDPAPGQELPPSSKEPQLAGQLRFSFLSEGNRAYTLHKQGQSGLVEKLLEASIQNPTSIPELPRTVAQLLLPAGFKDLLRGQDQLVLEVDAITATYPWELLEVSGQALVLEMSLVRQLPASGFPQRMRQATSRSAYVIGNPSSEGFFKVFMGEAPKGTTALASLEGARTEAERVLQLLEQGSYACEFSIEADNGVDVINKLYQQPYRVLHIAGHGVYEHPTRQGDRRSGVVLSNGILITAAEIEAMEVVPDLVFLNCCHLATVKLEPVSFNQLAASMAGQLLQMGVKAVVACGWAVDDRGAVVFAEAFYDAMLSGKDFGEAIFLARQQAHAAMPTSNTWGAYQAYGDPAYQLEPRDDRPNGASKGGVVVIRLPSAAWGFHDPLQRDHLPFAATADQADPLALTLVEIPAGRFLMGSPPDEPERSDDEGPQHAVELASFFISQSPITQAQWREVAQWEPREGERWERELKATPSRFQPKDAAEEEMEPYGSFRLLEGEASSDQRPVERVSWEEAMEFCRRLSQRTGRVYMLPSEAQWEYACRAGTTKPFAFGETITAELANYDGTFTYGNGPKGKNRKQTTPVGMFPPNAWGLQDMHGNVYEWCLDDWHESYEGAPVDGSAWVDGAEGSSKSGHKLLRGGSLFLNPGICRSAYRSHNRPEDASIAFGFRVVCLPQGPSLNA